MSEWFQVVYDTRDANFTSCCVLCFVSSVPQLSRLRAVPPSHAPAEVITQGKITSAQQLDVAV